MAVRGVIETWPRVGSVSVGPGPPSASHVTTGLALTAGTVNGLFNPGKITAPDAAATDQGLSRNAGLPTSTPTAYPPLGPELVVMERKAANGTHDLNGSG